MLTSLSTYVTIALSVLMPIANAYAQADAPTDIVEEYLASVGACFEDYRFGSVQFNFPEDQPQIRGKAGESISISGTVANTNEYPIPQGKILARVLQQDQRVAPENWHPIVGEYSLPDTYSLTPQGNVPFTFSWNIPSQAPTGIYRVEFYFVANSRYIFAGIPFVSNVSGGSALFSVEGTSDAGAVFDRSSVTLQGEKLELRSVPPILSATEAVSIATKIGATGANPISATLHTALHGWADTDGTPAISESTKDITISNTESLEIPFTWDVPRPGTFQLVLTATPTDSTLLPSIIKIRFSVEGNVQRIMYSGIGGYKADQAVITTCVANSTSGTGAGSIHTKVTSKDGSTIGESSTPVDPAVSVTTINIPRQAFSSTVQINTQAMNDQGDVIDEQTVEYTPDMFKTGGTPNTVLILLSLACVVFVLGGILFYLYKKQRAL